MTKLLVVLAAIAAGGEPRASVTTEGVQRHLAALQRIADRSDGNRAAGTAGERRTVAYVAAQLRRSGWRVRLEDVEFPFFDLRRTPKVATLRHRVDFEVLEYSPSARTRLTPRPFDSLGCEAAEYGDLDAGDLAIVNRGTCRFSEKALAAQEAGAGGLAVVDEELDRPVRATLAAPEEVRIPAISLTGPAASTLARADEPVALDLRTTSTNRTTHNVIADRGTGEPVVMAGAHLDSVAVGPGINDDGSGIAGLLAIAERRPDARLRFGFWTGEELGLFGSRAHVDGLSATEREAIAAYVNLDMIGSPNAVVEVYDTGNGVEEALRDELGEDVAEERVGGSSDHDAFRRAGIPIGGVYTGGEEEGPGGEDRDPCYHRACDDLDSVDPALTARIARRVERALVALDR